MQRLLCQGFVPVRSTAYAEFHVCLDLQRRIYACGLEIQLLKHSAICFCLAWWLFPIMNDKHDIFTIFLWLKICKKTMGSISEFRTIFLKWIRVVFCTGFLHLKCFDHAYSYMYMFSLSGTLIISFLLLFVDKKEWTKHNLHYHKEMSTCTYKTVQPVQLQPTTLTQMFTQP